MDLADVGALAEIAVAAFTGWVGYLMWASGYLDILNRSARKRRWGLSNISEARWPKRKGSDFLSQFEDSE